VQRTHTQCAGNIDLTLTESSYKQTSGEPFKDQTTQNEIGFNIPVK